MTPRTVHEVLELAAMTVTANSLKWDDEGLIAADEIRALKSTLPNLHILQEGMLAVPEEPTADMLFAACKMMGYDSLYGGIVRAAKLYYRAMLSAAKEGK